MHGLEVDWVIVSGPPGSGKSTLGRALADELGLPLIAKDSIKQALMRVLPPADVPASQQLGRASVQAMLAVARDCGRGVLESVWHRRMAAADLLGLGGRAVEVFCDCDPSVAAARYRARTGLRADGHFDADRQQAELYNDETLRPVAAGWPVLRVSTEAPVPIAELVQRIAAALS